MRIHHQIVHKQVHLSSLDGYLTLINMEYKSMDLFTFQLWQLLLSIINGYNPKAEVMQKPKSCIVGSLQVFL